MIKIVALVAILVLQATGIWSHLSEGSRTRLSNHAVSPERVASIAPTSSIMPVSGPWPIQFGTTPLQIPAKSVIAVDVASGTVMFSQNVSAKLPIASITKLVTALVILANHDLKESVTIPTLPEYGPDDERIGLVAGESYELQDLLRALLIQSANDAADALAIIDAGSTDKFVTRMNSKMTEWGISDTQFAGPSGLIDNNNYASAEALTKIARLALTNPFLRQVIAETSHTIVSAHGRIIALQTTNQLLYSNQFYGIKTGYTLAAGECFVGLTRINGHEVITVVLGASDRFGNTQALVNWIKSTWQWL